MQKTHVTKILTGFAALVCSSWLQAAEVDSTMSAIESRLTNLSGTVEVEPLPVLLNAVPGVGGAGLGGEIYITPRMSAMVGAAYTSADLGQGFLDRNAQDNPLPDTMQAYRVDLGARFYNAINTDSWYWGGKATYGENHAVWRYRDAEVEQSSAHLVPSLLAGYRWLWENGFSMRLGASAGPNLVQWQNVDVTETGTAAADAEDKVDTMVNAPVAGNLDFMLGYMF